MRSYDLWSTVMEQTEMLIATDWRGAPLDERLSKRGNGARELNQKN